MMEIAATIWGAVWSPFTAALLVLLLFAMRGGRK
jgi:hypothetical protein